MPTIEERLAKSEETVVELLNLYNKMLNKVHKLNNLILNRRDTKLLGTGWITAYTDIESNQALAEKLLDAAIHEDDEPCCFRDCLHNGCGGGRKIKIRLTVEEADE